MRFLLIILILFIKLPDANAQDTRKITLSDFTVELNQDKIDFDEIINDVLPYNEDRFIPVIMHDGIQYKVQFRFKRNGNRIKIRRKSMVILSDGRILNGKTKKEVQFMSTSVPGAVEFPVAENFVLDKEQFSTFFISYRTKVNYK